VYRIGTGTADDNALTESDITKKTITPMGGFLHCGIVKDDFPMLTRHRKKRGSIHKGGLN